MLAAGAIPALVALLEGESDRSKRNGAAALKSLAKRDEAAARAMVASGGVPALVALLHAGSSAVRLRSTAVLRSLVRHVPEARDAVLLLTAYYLLLTAYYSLLTTHYLLLTTCCSLQARDAIVLAAGKDIISAAET
jgi:hypothetical protein